jgi:YesN/AraC family two-component response regulator
MMLTDSPLLSILVQRPANFVHVIELDESTARTITDIHTALLWEKNQKQPFWKERLSSLITDILIQIYRFSSSYFPINNTTNAVKIVTEVQNYIVQNSHNEISLDFMANQHFVSKYYLSRIFKEITGYTFRDFLILHRLSVAKDMLTHTNKSVTDVCYYSGFNNINHFIRIFKKYEGLSGIVNIGVEGMMLSGAFAAVVGSYLFSNPWIGLLFAVAASLAMALLHAYLCITVKKLG